MGIKFHVHPPTNNWGWGCWWAVCDPGCAALGKEVNCIPIMQGKNKGNFGCLHVGQGEVAKAAREINALAKVDKKVEGLLYDEDKAGTAVRTRKKRA